MAPVRSFSSTPLAASTTPGPHPEQPARIPAIETELEARGWLGYERLASPAVERTAAAASTRSRTSRRSRRCPSAGGGHLDLDTVMSAGSWEAALHAAGGAVAAGRAAASRATRRPASARIARPATTRARRTRWASACSTTSPSPRATRIDALGLARVMILDWDVHHGNGTNDIFHETDDVLFVSHPPVAAVSGHRAARREAGSGRGSGTRSTCRCRRGQATTCYCRSCEMSSAPLARSYEPELVLLSAGYDAHVEDPLASAMSATRGSRRSPATMRALCADELQVPLGAVLEGGYALGALARGGGRDARGVAGFRRISGRRRWGAGGRRAARGRCAARRCRRIAEWWPQL